MPHKTLFTILLLFFSSFGFLQSQALRFSPFEGTAYKMISSRSYLPFDGSCFDHEVINKFVWSDINVPSRDVKKGFPDVQTNGAFGIIFTSTMTVSSRSLYAFTLNSDDGSILWIDDEEVINNDYSDGMHSKSDTIPLSPGTYAIKIWYFQAYPTEYGIIFNHSAVEGIDSFPIETMKLNARFLFSSGSFHLKNAAHNLLDSLKMELRKYEKAHVNIVGHTDNVGSETYNVTLSQKRAEGIRVLLMADSALSHLNFIATGLGSSKPIADNITSEGRAANRRVELIIERK